MVPGEYYNLDSSMPLAMKLFALLGQVSGSLNILMSCLLKGSTFAEKDELWVTIECEIVEGCRKELLPVLILSIGTSELRGVRTLQNSSAMNSSRMFWYFSEICENHRIRISWNSHGFWNAVAYFLPGIYGQSFFFVCVVSLIPSAIQFHCGCVMKLK